MVSFAFAIGTISFAASVHCDLTLRFYIMAEGNIYRNFDFDFSNKHATLDHYLSKGASGNVFGPIQWHDMEVAIKQVMFADGKVTDEFKKYLKTKIDIWASLDHKHLLGFHTVDLHRLPKVMFVVMEFAAGGSLNKTLRSLGLGNKLPIPVVTDWAKQIAEGMLYLHEKNIVHRDLKSSNILIMEPFKAGNSHTLKIADFDDVKEHDHTKTMSALVGTCAYMAPEVIKHERFSKASDVWSFGVVLWEMLTGDIPYDGLDSTAILSKSISGVLDKLSLGESFPEEYKLFLNRCWKSTSKKRLSFYEIFCVLHRMGTAEETDVIEILKYKGNMLQQYFPDDPRDKQKYLSSPFLIETIKMKQKWICGFAILDRELFVVCGHSSVIEVYDSMGLSFNRRLYLKDLIDPVDIVSCSRNKCIYISDYNGNSGQPNKFLRFDSSGKLITEWSTGDDWGYGLSVTDESNVILAVFGGKKLNEYSPDGQLIREINLSDTDIHFPWHAIKLMNGHFVVSHGLREDDLHRVCIVDADGKLMKSFGGKRGSNIGQMNHPVCLSVDKDGFVLVVDKMNSRILSLDSNLKFDREIPSIQRHRLENPSNILLVESAHHMVVGEDNYLFGGQIVIFRF